MEGSVNLSRRGFLKAKMPAGVPLRPPWALPEATFVTLCSRCDACCRECPTRIIFRGEAGFPQVDFIRGECTFCSACVDACLAGALQRPGEGAGRQPPWAHVATLTGACLGERGVVCRSCGDVCEPAAIRFPPRPGGVPLPALDADACTGCGACIGACPVSAITMKQGGSCQ